MKWLNWAMHEFLSNIPEEREANYATNFKFSYKQVEEVRLVISLIPFFLFMIMFWVVY